MRSRGAASNEGRRWRGDHFGALLVILVALLVLSGFGRRPLLRLAAAGLLVAAAVVMLRVLRGEETTATGSSCWPRSAHWPGRGQRTDHR
ncbi:MAG: hypothetical protein R2755_23865 [Acidimicrobiales bacterium]